MGNSMVLILPTAPYNNVLGSTFPVFISHMQTLAENWMHPMLVSPIGLGPSLDL